MSDVVENRVVQMEFDNKSFEKNAEQSTHTLKKLDEALKFKHGAKSIEDVEAAARKVNFQPLLDAAETVNERFSLMGQIAQTAIENITNRAVDSGLRLAKSLSIDQVTAGWQKYADETSSIKTLLGQGFETETIEKELARLSWYTDETSYDYMAMVDSIGKFTASGKGLEESTTALMGIANWAALSGQNASTAARAMYQISQAMGSGIMRKEDYKSIQNAAMDTDEFRQHALDAAVALGTLKDNLDGTYTSLINDQGAFAKSQFADHLTQDAWFTSEVMMSVFTDYSNAINQIYAAAEEKGLTASEVVGEIQEYAEKHAVSMDEAITACGYSFDEFGLKAFLAAQEARTFSDAIDSVKDAVSTQWKEIFKTIFGNAEEATVLWTDLANGLYDVFAGPLGTVVELMQDWNEMGGRTELWEAVYNILGAIGDRTQLIKDTVGEIFEAVDAKQLFQITHNLLEFSKTLEMSALESDTLKAVTTAVATIVQKLINVTVGLGDAVSPLFGIVSLTLKIAVFWLTQLLSKITDVLSKVDGSNLFKSLKNFNKSLVELYETVGALIHIVLFNLKKALPVHDVVDLSDAINFLITLLTRGLDRLTNDIMAFINGPLDTLLGRSHRYYKLFINMFGNAENAFSNLATRFSGIAKVIAAIFYGLFLAGKQYIYDPIKKWLSELMRADDPFKFLMDAISKALNQMKKLFGGSIDFGDIDSTKKAIIALSQVLLAYSKVAKAVSGVRTMANISRTAKDMSKSFKTLTGVIKSYKQSGVTRNITAITKSLTALVTALAVLTMLDVNKLWNSVFALISVIGALTALIAVSTLLSKAMAKSEGAALALSALAKAMIPMAIAIILLAKAFDMLANSGVTTWKQLGITVAALLAISGILLGFTALVGLMETKLTMASLTIVLMSVALLIMASAFEKLTKLKIMDGIANIEGIFIALASVAALVAVVGKPTLKGAAIIAGIAGALLLMTLAITKLTSIDLKTIMAQLGKMIPLFVAIAAIAIVVGVAIKALNKAKSPRIANEKSNPIWTIVAAAVAIGFAMIAMTSVIKAVKDVDGWAIVKAIVSVVAIAVVLGGLIFVLSKIGDDISGKSVAKIISTLIVIILVLKTMVIALVALAAAIQNVSIGALIGAGVIIGFVGGLIGAFVWLLTKASKVENTSGMKHIVAALLILLALFGVLFLLTKTQDLGAIWMAIVEMAAIAAIIGLLFAGLSYASKWSEKAKMAPLLAAALALAALVGALYLLKDINPEQLIWTAVSMAVVMLALGGMLRIVNGVNVSITMILAMIVVVGAMVVLAYTIADVAQIIQSISLDGIDERLKKIGLMTLGLVALTAALVLIGVIAVGILPGVAIVIAVLITLGGIIWVMSVAFEKLAILVATLEGKDMYEIMDGLAALAKGLLQVALAGGALAIALVVLTVAGVLFFAFALSMHVASASINAFTESLINLADFLSAIGRAWKNSDGNFLGFLSNLGDEIAPAKEKALESISEASTDAITESTDDSIKAVEDVVDAVTDGAVSEIEANREDMIEAAESATDGIRDAVEQNTKKSIWSGIGGLFGGGNKLKLTSLLSGGLGDALGNVDTDQIGNLLTANIGNSISEKMGSMPLDLSGFGGQFTDAIDIDQFGNIGNMLGGSFSGGLSEGMTSDDMLSSLTDSGIELGNTTASGFESVDYATSGRHAVNGLIAGLTDHLSITQVQNAASGLASSALSAFNTTLDINSPSKKMAESGMYMVMGLSKGLQDYMYQAETASGGMAVAVHQAFEEELQNEGDIGPRPVIDMSELYSQIDEFDSTWRPVIKPTLDMSDVNPGLQNLQAVAAYRSASTGTYEDTSSPVTNNQTYSPTINVYGAVGQDVNDLADIVMMKMQLQYDRKANTFS